MRATILLDASALLAFLRNESGGAAAGPHLDRAGMGTANWSEAIAKETLRGLGSPVPQPAFGDLGIELVDFDRAMAETAAQLAPLTSTLGLSFADRAGLAVAKVLGLPVLTADRQWARLDLGVEVRLIR